MIAYLRWKLFETAKIGIYESKTLSHHEETDGKNSVKTGSTDLFNLLRAPIKLNFFWKETTRTIFRKPNFNFVTKSDILLLSI